MAQSLTYEAILDASKFQGGLQQALQALGQLDTRLATVVNRSRSSLDNLDRSADNAARGLDELGRESSRAINVPAIDAGKAALERVEKAAHQVSDEVRGIGESANKAAHELQRLEVSQKQGGGLSGNVSGFLAVRAAGAASGDGGGGGMLGGALALAGRFAGPLAAAAGVAKLLKEAIPAAAQMEGTMAAFEALTGSAQKASSAVNDLRILGARTPFEFPELANAGRLLIAFGEDADSVADTLRRIGDVASGIQQPIGEIAEIYGKARVQGTLFAEDINQLVGRGIPVIQEFAKQLGVSESEVKKLGSEGKITFSMLEQAFIDLTSEGGKFHDMMQRQSETLSGKWSNLTDTAGEFLRTIGEGLVPAAKILVDMAQGYLGVWTDILQVMSGVKSLADAIADRDPARAAAEQLSAEMDRKLAEQASVKAALEGASAEEQERIKQQVLGERQRQLEARRRLGISDDVMGGLTQKHLLGVAEEDLPWAHERLLDELKQLFGDEGEVGKKLRAALEVGNYEEAERLNKVLQQIRESRRVMRAYELEVQRKVDFFRSDPKIWEQLEAQESPAEAATAPVEAAMPELARVAPVRSVEPADGTQGDGEEESRRIRTLGLSDSARRQWERLSRRDKARYGNNFNRWLASQPMLRGRVRPELATQLDQSQAPRARASATRDVSGGGSDSGKAVNDLLKKIEKNTADIAEGLKKLTKV